MLLISEEKNYFDGYGTQGVYKYFEDTDVSKTIIKFHANSWISKGLSDEKISSVVGFTRPFIEYTNARIKLKFDGSILREKLSTSLGLIANYYIVYRLNPRINSSNIVLENCLFGKIKFDLIYLEFLVIQMEEMVKMLLFLGLT